MSTPASARSASSASSRSRSAGPTRRGCARSGSTCSASSVTGSFRTRARERRRGHLRARQRPARGRGRPDAADRPRQEAGGAHDAAQPRRPVDRRPAGGGRSGSTAHGVRFAPGGIRKGAAGHDICFIHPKGNDEFPIGGEGVLIELVQAPPEVVAAWQATRTRMTIHDDPEDGRPAPAAHRAAGRALRHARAARARRRHVRDHAMRSTAPAWPRRRSASTCSS